MTDSILSSGIFLFVFTSKHIIIKNSVLFPSSCKRKDEAGTGRVWFYCRRHTVFHWCAPAECCTCQLPWCYEQGSEKQKWAVSSELSWSTWCCEQGSEQWVQNCLDPLCAVSSEFRTALIHLVLWAVSSELSWSTWCCEQGSEQWVQNCLDPPSNNVPAHFFRWSHKRDEELLPLPNLGVMFRHCQKCLILRSFVFNCSQLQRFNRHPCSGLCQHSTEHQHPFVSCNSNTIHFQGVIFVSTWSMTSLSALLSKGHNTTFGFLHR